MELHFIFLKDHTEFELFIAIGINVISQTCNNTFVIFHGLSPTIYFVKLF